ncbi:Anaerobic ribonucleoside-triphosphate reductase-activating protein [Gammaproteobacteria bacterium]
MTNDRLQLAAYLPCSRVNGPGLRSVVWVQGCPFRCPGCFNPDFLPFTGGWSASVAEVVAQLLAEKDSAGVSFSGGEPFAQARPLAEVAEQIRAAGKSILIFTGFQAATLDKSTNPGIRRLLAAADLLVAGPYQRKHPYQHPLLVSANQELIFLTERYRSVDFAPRRMEFRIDATGAVTATGLLMSKIN